MKPALFAVIAAVVLLLGVWLCLGRGASPGPDEGASAASAPAASPEAAAALSGEKEDPLSRTTAAPALTAAAQARAEERAHESGAKLSVEATAGRQDPSSTLVQISLDADADANGAEFAERYKNASPADRRGAFDSLTAFLVAQKENAAVDKSAPLTQDQIAAIEREMAWLKEHLVP